MRAIFETKTGMIITEVNLSSKSIDAARSEVRDIADELSWPSKINARIYEGNKQVEELEV